MSSTTHKKISFNKEEKCDFITTLRARVNDYLKENQISSKANFSMFFKTCVFFLIISLVLTLIVFFNQNLALFLILSTFLGFFVSTGSMNVVHDALHGAYLSSPKKNRALGFLMDFIGVSSFYWKKEHTVDHHTFTNINEHDADLDVPFILRLSPKSKKISLHRFQHLYAPFLYCLNFFHWAYISDFKRIYRILRGTSKENPSKLEACLLIFFKLLHIALFVILPMIVLNNNWYIILLGYVAYLFSASLTMTTIFQLAHIVENVSFPEPCVDGKINNSFAKHQLATTCNFATKSNVVGFLFGGLNFQIEHHLFPLLCHVHLKKIAPIVEKTAYEFGLTYHKNESLLGALKSHFRTLKQLGTDLQKAHEPSCRPIEATKT
jgi:linoleoyl-CoA desaturase